MTQMMRPATCHLPAATTRTDTFSLDVRCSAETNSLVRVERPSGRQAFISYHPSARHQQIQGMSRRGLSGLFTVRYDVNRTVDAGELLVSKLAQCRQQDGNVVWRGKVC